MRLNLVFLSILSLLSIWYTSPVLQGEIITLRKPEFRSIHFINKSYGWIAGQGGVFYTTDGGESWRRRQIIVSSRNNFSFMNAGWIAWADTDAIIICSDKGLVFGSSASDQWQERKIDGRILEKLVYILFIDQDNGWGITSLREVYRTSDGGISWHQTTLPPSKTLLNLFALSSKEAWAVGENAIAVHTIDGGQSWHRKGLYQGLNLYESTAAFLSVHFVNTHKGWISGTNGVVLRTTDGGTNWERQNTPYEHDTGLASISFANEDEGWIIGQRYLKEGRYEPIILYTENGGLRWNPVVIKKDSALIDVQAQPNGQAWIICENGVVLRTKDKGKTWIEVIIK